MQKQILKAATILSLVVALTITFVALPAAADSFDFCPESAGCQLAYNYVTRERNADKLVASRQNVKSHSHR